MCLPLPSLVIFLLLLLLLLLRFMRPLRLLWPLLFIHTKIGLVLGLLPIQHLALSPTRQHNWTRIWGR
jgi:hypothetical protein